MTKKSNLGGVNSHDGSVAVKNRYNLWAEQYEQDLAGVNYRLPTIMAAIADRYIKNKNSKILDAGAGAGLSGLALHKCGFSELTAIDFSPEMLSRAKETKVYKDIKEADLSKLDLPDNSYDHTISVGTIGVAPKTALKELVRVTRGSGFIIFSNRTNEHYDRSLGFEGVCLEMIADGLWDLVESQTDVVADSRPGTSPFVVFVYRKKRAGLNI